MKQYPLELENIGTDVYTIMSRGHQDLKSFMDNVSNHYSSWYKTLGNPEHIYFKAIPARNKNFKCLYIQVDASVKGSFPVTYVSEGSDKNPEYLKSIIHE